MPERSCTYQVCSIQNSIYYLISMLTISRHLSTCSAPQHLLSTLAPSQHLCAFSAPLCFLSTTSVLSGFLGTFVSNLVLRCCTYPLDQSSWPGGYADQFLRLPSENNKMVQEIVLPFTRYYCAELICHVPDEQREESRTLGISPSASTRAYWRVRLKTTAIERKTTDRLSATSHCSSFHRLYSRRQCSKTLFRLQSHSPARETT